MHATQEIIHAEEGHQHRIEGQDRRKIKQPQVIAFRYQAEMRHDRIYHHRNQRPRLLRVPAPITSPRLIRPDRSQESTDRHQGQSDPKWHLVHDTQFSYPFFEHHAVLLPAYAHHHQIRQADQTANTEETISSHDNRHMEHQPWGFQDRNQRIDLRVHPTQAGHEQDDPPE